MFSLRLKALVVIQLSVLFVYADGFSLSQTNQFECGNGNTVLQDFLCDEEDDCGNGADERNCSRGNLDTRPTADSENPVTWPTEDPDQFDCENGKTVPQYVLCDEDDDCGNGADERNCNRGNPVTRISEDPDEFDCGNENTVPQSNLCDSFNDCGNGADERNCFRGPFDCGNGNTVAQHLLCDGDDDCKNGADERNCNRATRLVMGLFFDCGNSRYIHTRSICDGNDDCGNFADESDCNQDTDVAVRTPLGRVVTSMFLKGDASIESPGFPQDYPHNLNVLWNVSTVPGHRLKVAFIVKELEDSRGCSADQLSLFDGQELSSSPLGVYCRHHEEELPEPVVSSSNAMLVQFTSDSSISWKGFQISLSTVCGGILLAQPSENEFLSHPKFGEQAYGENISCDWIIKSGPEKNVQITFSDFDVGTAFQGSDAEELLEEIVVIGCEDSNTGNCVQYNTPEENGGSDFVEIYDEPNDSSKRIGKYSGDQIPPTITSRGQALVIRMRAGLSGNFRGFRVVYQEV